MKLDEAIKHCEDVAERYERMEDSHDEKLKKECLQCAADHRQLAEWLRKLKEAKRLLKLAMSDLAEADHYGLCKYERDEIATCQSKPVNCFVWRYADEAEKLIGEDGDTA